MSFDGPTTEAAISALTRGRNLTAQAEMLAARFAQEEKLIQQLEISINKLKELMQENAVERGAVAETLRQCLGSFGA